MEPATVIDLDHLDSIRQGKPWQPYEHVMFAYSSWEPLVRGMRAFLPWRWALCAPMQRYLFRRVSIGSIIMTMVLLGLLAWGGVAWLGRSPGDSGNPAGLAMALCLLVVGHHSLCSLLLGMPFESNLRWHMWLGNVTALLSFNHGVHTMWAQDRLQWKDMGYDSTYITGWVATLALVPLFFSARAVIRRRWFNFFFANHWLWFLTAVIAALIHGAGIVALGIVCWGVDFLYRSILSRMACRPHQAKIEQLPSKVVRISFPRKSFTYIPGQYLFVCIPKISMMQYHPLSISSSPHQDTVTLHVRVLGDWTKKLFDLAKDSPTVQIFVDGPAGQAHVDFDGPTYKHFIFVSGGIGITPMESIANALIEQQSRGREIKKLAFVWAVTDKSMIETMVPENEKHAGMVWSDFQSDSDIKGEGFLYSQVHITRGQPEASVSMLKVRSGHPDMAAICKSMAELAKGEPVAVLSCGPARMIRSIRSESSKYPNFHFHSETFDF